MERSTCACCNELKAPSRTRTVSIEEGGSWLARIRTRLTWEHTTFACSDEVIDSTKRLYALFVRGPFVGWDSFGSRRCGHRGTWKNNSLASFERPIYRGIPAPLSLSPALLSSLVLPKYSSPMCFVARVLHRASTSFEIWPNLEVLP